MKKILFIICILFSSGLFAQGIYNNGGKIVIGSGVTLYIGGNYQNETNVSDGSIDLSGTLKLEGNFTNNVAAADAIGTAASGSKVELIGTATQTIGGTTSAPFIFPDLTINNSSGVIISKSIKVTGALTFTSGLVDIGNNHLTFGQTASVAGTPSATSMIVATGAGEVRKESSGTGSFTFPVGDNTATAEYSPVSLNFTAGTFNPGAYAGVNLVNTAYTDPYISGSYLNRYWNVSQTGITSFTCDVAFNYQNADVTGTESNIYGIRITPAPISLFDRANSALHQLTATGLTSFGTFTGAIGLRTLNLNVFLEGLYNGAGTMRQAQDAIGSHWPNGIADHISVELHDAATYATIHYTTLDVSLSTTGLATVNIPANYSGSYYLTVKHRNSIETTSASPVLFSTSTINYNFTSSASMAFGSNMKDMGGVFAIYGGDVDVDGSVGINDMGLVDNASATFVSGYVPEDVDGDGSVGISDMGLIDNNSANFVSIIVPN